MLYVARSSFVALKHAGHPQHTYSACASILTDTTLNTLINVIFTVDAREAGAHTAVARASHDVVTEPFVLTWGRHAVVHVHLTVVSEEAFKTRAPVPQVTGCGGEVVVRGLHGNGTHYRDAVGTGASILTQRGGGGGGESAFVYVQLTA